MKEAYYFSHDANARQDVKIMALMDAYGWSGYGMYWAIIEALRSEPGYKLPNKPYTIAAFQRMFNDGSNDVPTFINDLVNKFELLVKDDEFIFSPSLIRRMKDVDKRRLNAQNAGKISAAKRAINKENTTAVPTSFQHSFNDAQQGNKIKLKEKINKTERKKEDIKGKTSRFSAPTKEELFSFFTSSGLNTEDAQYKAERFIQFYDSKGWMVGKNKMTNWKTAATRSLEWEDKRKSSAAGPESYQTRVFNNAKNLSL